MEALNNTRARLKTRSNALQSARNFFLSRGLLEVDCYILGASASIDVHIDLFGVSTPIHGRRYLFSSPEYPMKRLLTEDSGDIFYLGHVFRNEVSSPRHVPEFTMAEWYRVGLSFHGMIDETLLFIQTILSLHRSMDSWTIHRYTYQNLFEKICEKNPHTISQEELLLVVEELFTKEGLSFNKASSYSKDDLLHLIMSTLIEPSLKKQNNITIISHFPASQAALAKKEQLDNSLVAERFEIYVEGIEIANGYHELSDPKEQLQRFQEDNLERLATGKEEYPIDMAFIDALSKAPLPDCSGVAVGFDRLLMRALQQDSIDQVVSIPWSIS